MEMYSFLCSQVYDNDGNTGQDTIIVNAANNLSGELIPPTLTVVSPQENDVINAGNCANVVIEGSATDNAGINHIWYALNVNDGGTPTDLLFLDGTNSRVGIGTTGPGYKLQVESTRLPI